MILVDDFKGLSKTYKGTKGDAVITRNCGNKDKIDRWSVSVVVDGKYKRLATRVEFTKAIEMAKAAID